MKAGDTVRTVYGNLETVLRVEPSRIVTVESASRSTWYHPTKVWRVLPKTKIGKNGIKLYLAYNRHGEPVYVTIPE